MPGTVDKASHKKRKALATAREICALYGRESCLGSFEFEGEHVFPKEGREAAYAWLKRWLARGDNPEY